MNIAIIYTSTCFAGSELLFEKMNSFERAIIERIAKTDKSVSQIDEDAISKIDYQRLII